MNDFDNLMKYFGIFDDSICSILKKQADIRFLNKNESVIYSENSTKRIYFLIDGVLRTYIVNENGEDITNSFIFRYGQPYIEGFLPEHNRLFAENSEALCPVKIISFPKEELMILIQNSLPLMNLYCRVLTELYRTVAEYKNMLLHTSAYERYLWFLDRFPGLINLVPHKCIASFLNVTPVTLSRVRRAIRESGEIPPHIIT